MIGNELQQCYTTYIVKKGDIMPKIKYKYFLKFLIPGRVNEFTVIPGNYICLKTDGTIDYGNDDLAYFDKEEDAKQAGIDHCIPGQLKQFTIDFLISTV
jgi:hypothetical protein